MDRSAVLKGFFFIDNVAPRTNVQRDDSSTGDGRVRTAQVCAQTRHWAWSWMGGERKEHAPLFVLASYLFILPVIPISADFWRVPTVVSLADFSAGLLWVLGFSLLHYVPENFVGTRAVWGRHAEWRERVVPQLLLPHQAPDDPWGVASCHI